jgi:hypothetical protein
MNKAEIKEWLDSIKKDRQWLAEKIGTTKPTLDGWFSTRDFPNTALKIIEGLMRESSLAAQGRVVTSFTNDEFEEIEAAREVIGSPTRSQFYHDAIMEYAKNLLADSSEKQSKEDTINLGMVLGEDPLEYKVTRKPEPQRKKRA